MTILNHRYILHDKLGEGGMGAVFQATDRLTGETLALKRVMIDPADLSFMSQSTTVDLQTALAHEFKVLSALRHPHIISVLDYGFDEDGYPYFAMPLLTDACPLTEAAQGLPIHEQVALLIQLLQALAYLHHRGVLHRDLKPGNVLVQDGVVYLLDFGLAATLNEGGTHPVGTVTHMAPETLRNSPASAQSDLYAVGVMAYEILTGQYPFAYSHFMELLDCILAEEPDWTVPPFEAAFTGETTDMGQIAAMQEPPPPPPANQLLLVLQRLLAKHPALRPASALEVIANLSAAINQPLPAETNAIREGFLQAADFVGREDELETLVDAFMLSQNGEGSARLIGGESGVGKSRLVDELRIPALVRGAVVVQGQAVENAGLPHQIWREPVRRLLLSADVSEADALALKAIIPDIDDLLGRDLTAATRLTGTMGHRRLSKAIANLFLRQTRPVVLILEDLQWARTSLEPLRRLVELVEDMPLLIVATYRDDEAPTLPDQLPDMEAVRLERLSPDAVALLSESMLGGRGAQPQVVALLQRETEGNALFLVEVVRALAEEAGHREAVGAMNLPDSVLTAGIEQILRRRLEQVPRWAQRGLKIAAVAGRELDLLVMKKLLNRLLKMVRTDHLATMTRLPGRKQTGVSFDEWLVECADAGILEVRDNRWRFTHDRLRTVLLNQQPARELAFTHQHIAYAIEAVYPDDARYALALAEHWTAAGEATKAADYAMRAGKQLGNAGDFPTAKSLLQRTMRLPGLTDEQRDDLLWLLEALEIAGGEE